MEKPVSKILLLICTCFLIFSCKKESPKNQVENSLVASLSENLTLPLPIFGVIPANVDGADRMTVARELNVSYVRDGIIVETFDGKAPMLDKYNANGFKVLLNLLYYQGNPTPFPTDMVTYRSKLESILNKYRPEVAVIENEPANDGYYTGPIEDYFKELSTAITVCHARGIKIADGALHTGMVMILVYQDYVNKGLVSQADDFASRALSPQYLRAAQGKGSDEINAKLEKCKKMLKAYKNMALDYVNFHWYEPLKDDNNPAMSAPGVAKEVADYIRSVTGKQVLTNEFGQTNQIPALVASQVSEFKLANLAYAIDFSGKGGGGGVNSQPLTDGLTILPNGVAFRKSILY